MTAQILVNAQSDTSKFSYIQPLFDFDPLRPLFTLRNEQSYNQSHFLRFYALTGYREGIETNSPLFGINFDGINDSTSNTRRLYMYNLSIEEMLTHGMVPRDHVVLEVKDPSKYRYLTKYGSKENWMRKNAHCFEFLMPIGTLSVPLLDEVLCLALHVKIARETRKIKTFVLGRSSKKEKFKAKENYNGFFDGKGKFKNVTFSAFKNVLKSDSIPFLDDTGYLGKIDLDLHINDWNDIKKVNQQLLKYDLTLTEQMRDMEMFIITELQN